LLIREQRGRVYLKSNEEDGVPIYGTNSKKCPYGCPAFSLGEPYHNEVLLPKGYKTVVDWLWEVACTGEGYENPEVVVEREESEVGQVEWAEDEAGDKRVTEVAGDALPTDGQEAAGKDSLQGNPEAGGVQGGENGGAGASPAVGSTSVEEH
jgi:hypothetical protein